MTASCIWNYMRATGKAPCGAPLTGPIRTHGYWCDFHKTQALTAWLQDPKLSPIVKKPAPDVIKVSETYL